MLKVDQNSVQADGPVRARLQAADFGSAGQEIARGVENLGEGINRAGQDLDAIGRMYDTAAVKQADADDLKQIMDIRTQALSAQGFDAQTAVANARQQIADVRKNRMAGLHNNRQRQMYADVFDQRNLQLEETFGTHLFKEVQEANKNAAVARAETSQDAAVGSYGTAEFETNLGSGLREIATINAGAGADVISRAQRKYASSVYSKVVDGLLSDPSNIQTAKQVLDQHTGDLTPDDETTLRKKLNPLLEEDQTESDAGWAFTNSGIPGKEDEPASSPTEGPETPPRPAVTGPSSHKAVVARPISPTDPLRGKGRITETAAGHRARGSGNALDIAAPAGTPIYPPMSGKVVKNFWSAKGGWSILVQHPNGYVTGYAHMRSQSPLEVGQEVESDTAIGSVGATGHATGPHVHYTVRQSPGGPKVDPTVAQWDSVDVPASQTVHSGKPDWKEAEPIRYKADENALGRGLDRLYQRAQAENWSPRRYQAAVARVRQIAGVQNELFNQRQDQQWNVALESVVGLGDKFTSVSQIPGFGLLEPQRRLQLQNMAKANLNAAAGDGVKADGPQYAMYLRQMYEDPEHFKTNQSFATDPNITNGERISLFKQQEDLKKDTSLSGRMDEAHTMAVRFLPKEMSNNGAYQQAYMDAVTRRQSELGKPLTDTDKLDIARALAVRVARKGHPLGYAFELRDSPGAKGQIDIPSTFNGIPPTRRQEIVNTLAARGLPHSPRNVVEFYLQNAR